MHVQRLAVEALAPHPANPRGTMKPEEYAELAAAIASVGLLSPLVVRVNAKRADRWTILAGHRRLAAVKSLGWTEVDCVVVADLVADEVSELDSFAIMLADNIHRVDLDVVRAGAFVAEFLARNPELSVKAAAAKLGKSERWLANVRAVGTLVPAWRKRRDDPKDAASGLSDAQLVSIAKLSPVSQERLAKELREAWQLRELERALASETHRLADAPWDLDDAGLVKKAGACGPCPKTSLGTPGLFDGTGDAGDVKLAICRDGVCYSSKLVAWTVAKVKALMATEPGCIVLWHAPGEHFSGEKDSRLLPMFREAGVEIQEAYEFTLAKGKAGGKPAYVVGGSKAGQIVRVNTYRDESGRPERAEPRRAGTDLTAEETRASKRLKLVFRACGEACRKLEAPKSATVLGLVRAYGMSGARGEGVGALRKAVESTAGVEDFVAAVWPAELRNTVELRFSMTTTAPQVAERKAELLWLAEVLGLDVAEFQKAALVEIPDPVKSGKVTSAKPPKVKAAKPATSKRKAKATAK